MESAVVTGNSIGRDPGPGSSLESYCFLVTRGALLELYHCTPNTIKAVSQYG